MGKAEGKATEAMQKFGEAAIYARPFMEYSNTSCCELIFNALLLHFK
jgi:hypothetical protein